MSLYPTELTDDLAGILIDTIKLSERIEKTTGAKRTEEADALYRRAKEAVATYYTLREGDDVQGVQQEINRDDYF